jgi:hypothetical protein
MTLREESGNAPPTGSETGGQPQEPVAQPQEPPGHPQEPMARSQESSAHPLEATPSVPTAREAPSPPLEVPAPREAPPQEVSTPREAPPQMEVSTPREAPASPAAVAPPRRRRGLAAILVGGLAAVCLIGVGAFATVLLLHGRHHAPAQALPSVFRLQVGQCVNYGADGISSPTVVPCAQAHDAEVYARFALAGHSWPGSAAIGAQARRGCTARLGGYLNPQLATTVLAESYVFPDQGAWNAGERAVICEIRSTAGKLTGSVRGLS